MAVGVGTALVSILESGTAEVFEPHSNGVCQIVMHSHGGNDLTLQVSVDGGTTWIDTDVDFDAVGVKRFGVVRAKYQLSGTLTGAAASAAMEEIQ